MRDRDVLKHSVDNTVTVGWRKLHIDLGNRSHLQDLRNLAEMSAESVGTNLSWQRVYLRLADAASELDAYLARCEVKEDAGT
jgi:hypothetical protein